MNWDPDDYCEIERPWRMKHSAFIALSAFALLFIAAMAFGDQEVTVKPGRLKKIETTLESKKFIWKAVGDFDMIEDTSGKYATTLFPVPGKYTLIVIGAKGDQPLAETITVTVEGVVPPPPIPPGPDPLPVPDAFSKSLVQAWQSEADPDKLKQRDGLAAIYAYGQARIHDTATWADFFTAMADKALEQKVSHKLGKVQQVIRNEAARILPKSLTVSNPIDSADRGTAQQFFERVVKTLQTLN